MRAAIIGAGISGLACADGLSRAGWDVRLFDKARGAGGRMSTRRIQTAFGEAAFDHGAQYFTARDPYFKSVVVDWACRGVAAPWPPAGGEAWVGTPGMSAVVADLAARQNVKWNYLVTGLSRGEEGWRIWGGGVFAGAFDAIILAIPAEQAAGMLGLHDLRLASIASLAKSQPCWAAMFAFQAPLPTERIIFQNEGVIGWAARNSDKPGRGGLETWVVQANSTWSAENLQLEPAEISGRLLRALAEAVGSEQLAPVSADAHRWRYAMASGTKDRALWNSQIGLGVCGDWLLGPRVECAWLSGAFLARQMSTTAQAGRLYSHHS